MYASEIVPVYKGLALSLAKALFSMDTSVYTLYIVSSSTEDDTGINKLFAEKIHKYVAEEFKTSQKIETCNLKSGCKNLIVNLRDKNFAVAHVIILGFEFKYNTIKFDDDACNKQNLEDWIESVWPFTPRLIILTAKVGFVQQAVNDIRTQIHMARPRNEGPMVCE